MTRRSDPYLVDRILTAAPEQLIQMLLDRAVAECGIAAERLDAGDVVAAHPHLGKAQDIIAELRCSLDLSVGPIAANLDTLYDFSFSRLVDAHLGRDGSKARDAQRALEPIQDAWRQACTGVPATLDVDAGAGVSARA